MKDLTLLIDVTYISSLLVLVPVRNSQVLSGSLPGLLHREPSGCLHLRYQAKGGTVNFHPAGLGSFNDTLSFLFLLRNPVFNSLLPIACITYGINGKTVQSGTLYCGEEFSSKLKYKICFLR